MKYVVTQSRDPNNQLRLVPLWVSLPVCIHLFKDSEIWGRYRCTLTSTKKSRGRQTVHYADVTLRSLLLPSVSTLGFLKYQVIPSSDLRNLVVRPSMHTSVPNIFLQLKLLNQTSVRGLVRLKTNPSCKIRRTLHSFTPYTRSFSRTGRSTLDYVIFHPVWTRYVLSEHYCFSYGPTVSILSSPKCRH